MLESRPMRHYLHLQFLTGAATIFGWASHDGLSSLVESCRGWGKMRGFVAQPGLILHASVDDAFFAGGRVNIMRK